MPDLTNDQIRDRLAEIKGWRKTGSGRWKHPDHKIPGIASGSGRKHHPIPPLDSPEALGVVAGMLPEGWAWDRIDFHPESHEVLVWVWMGKSIRSRDGCGPTETIARALAVIAAHEAEGARP